MGSTIESSAAKAAKVGDVQEIPPPHVKIRFPGFHLCGLFGIWWGIQGRRMFRAWLETEGLNKSITILESKSHYNSADLRW